MKNNAQQFCLEIKKAFSEPNDLIEREIVFANRKLKFMYMLELIDEMQLYQSILMPIQTDKTQNVSASELMQYMITNILYGCNIEIITTKQETINKILKGNVIFVADDTNQIIAADIEKIVVRPISIPPTSTTIKGPREGFNESIKQNLALLRNRLSTEDLTIEFTEVGKYTKTKVAVAYIKNIANKKIAKVIYNKIKNIKIDGIIDSFYISTFLQERPKSIFRQVGDTEKPDILAAKLLEGRIAILVDGSPIALTLPYVLLEDLQDANDYYHSEVHVTFLRILRLIGVLIATLLPAVYVALQIYHYSIMPTEFLTTIINTTQSIPFTPFSEIVFIILLFEILYEANLRMPQYLGLALSIVGALILGETAVNAGLVSPPAVMIVALSGLTFYTIPNLAQQFSLIRLGLVLVAGLLGLYGILMCAVFIVSYMCSFDSYQSAYLAPIAPYIQSDQKDFIFKKNVKEMVLRPKSIAKNKKVSKRIDLNGKDKF